MEHLILINQALRVLLVVCAPLIAAIAVGGTVISAVMAASGIQDRSINYAARVIIVVGILYYFTPYAATEIARLAELSLK